MLLPREFVGYLAKQIVKQLSPLTLEATDSAGAEEAITTLISDELAAEDQLNDEVREILEQYTNTCAAKASVYQEMFRKIKNTLIRSARWCGHRVAIRATR